MLSGGGGASPTGGFEYGTGVAVWTPAIMSRSDIREVTLFSLTLRGSTMVTRTDRHQWGDFLFAGQPLLGEY